MSSRSHTETNTAHAPSEIIVRDVTAVRYLFGPLAEAELRKNSHSRRYLNYGHLSRAIQHGYAAPWHTYE
jgi:hypothetical protein